MTVPTTFAKKVGNAYHTFHLKGRYEERAEAEKYKNWQNNVNNSHAVVVKKGSLYVVYIRNNVKFRTLADAKAYLRYTAASFHPPSEIRKFLKERGY